ncbi:hypothetical protein Tco_1397579, partial [Tanacetum coccineum]
VMAVTATIDRKVKLLVIKASIRRYLKLKDSEGLNTLPTAEILSNWLLWGFIQILFNKHKRLLFPYTKTYPTPLLLQKLFNNMKRASKGYFGVITPLFETMLVQHQADEPSIQASHETSPSRITSSSSLSPQTHPSTSQPQTTPVAEEATQMPYKSPLQSVHSLGRDEGSLSLNELMVLYTSLSKKVKSLESELHQTKQIYSTAFTKLIKRVNKLEHTIKRSQARRSFKVVLSDDEEEAEDPFKHGRKISDIDKDPTISLVQDEGTSWFQEDPEIQKKISDDTEVVLEEEEPTELVEDQGSGEKGEKEVSTVGAEHSTAIPEVSTAAANLVYIRRSAKKRKDKEIARQLQEEINIAGQEKVVTEDDQSHDINWNDPSVIRFYTQQNRPFSKEEVGKNMCMYIKNQGGYKMSYFKGMSYEDIRPIFERVWDQNNAFIPKDSEIEKEVMKRPGFDLQQDNSKRQKMGERSISVEEPKDKEQVEPSQEEIQEMKIILPEEGMHVEALQTKYLLIGREIHSEDTMKF